MITGLIYLLCLTPLAFLAVQATVSKNRLCKAIDANVRADQAADAQLAARRLERAQRATGERYVRQH